MLKEQLRSAEGEKYDIEDQIKKLDNVTVRYQKEFPRLKTNVEALDDQIKVLGFELIVLKNSVSNLKSCCYKSS